MYPWLLPEIFGYTLPVYDIMIGIGCAAMLIYVALKFERKEGFNRNQTNKLLVLIVLSLLFALLTSWIADGIFHSIEEGELEFGSITFLGGLVGGVVFFLLFLKYFYKDDNKDIRKMMNVILTGVVLAHAFGRIGCFFAGCCYGIPTDSFLGVAFPYGHAPHVYEGSSVFPTQLFEAGFLFALFFFLDNVKRVKGFQMETYLLSYGVFRIAIEFIRGDERGVLFPVFETQYNIFPTPSQFMSVIMIGIGVYLLVKHRKQSTIHTI